MIKGVLLSHGQIAQAVFDAAQRILGEIKGVQMLSVTSLSAVDIYKRLEEAVRDIETEDSIVILASLKGGSGWNAAAKLAKTNDKIKVVSGVNLPMFLSFVTKRDKIPLSELMETLCADAIRGIDVLELNV